MTPRSPVTEHALLRWLERVRRIDFSACPPHYDQHDLIQHGCREIGMTPAEAREEIAPERVRGFIERGATAIRYPSWTLVVEGGSIVTVIPHGKRRYRGGATTAETPPVNRQFRDRWTPQQECRSVSMPAD